jgi:iron complex outermembrane receptor protein
MRRDGAGGNVRGLIPALLAGCSLLSLSEAAAQSTTPLPPVVVQAPQQRQAQVARPAPARSPARAARPSRAPRVAARPAQRIAARPAPAPAPPAAPAQPNPGDVPGVISSRGFVTQSSRSATKTDTPLLETPQSISTVTRPQLEQLQPQTLAEALNYTPGVRVGAYGLDPRFDSFYIRGTDVTYSGVFRDGLRQTNSPSGLFRLEPYGVEAINILRGPASSVYGASNTGGIVDIISKRPLATPFHEIELQSGSFARKQGAFDLSGPVTPDGSVLYRLTGLVRGADSQIRAAKDDRVYIAPAFTFQPTDSTKLTILGEYMDSTIGGTYAYVNDYRPYWDRTGLQSSQSYGATKTYLGDRRYNDFRQQQARIGYEFEHRFSDMFTLRQRLRYSTISQSEEFASSGDGGLVRETNSGLSADTLLESQFRTGPVEHTLITGVDVSDLTYNSKNGFGGVPLGYNPHLPDRSQQTLTGVGLYAQDQMKLGGWRLTLGARHDWLHSDFKKAYLPGPYSQIKQDNERTTGRVALGYVFDSGIAPYVAYATSFTPNPGVPTNTGQPAQPTTGEQIEGGVKYDVPGMNLSLRAAGFDLRQKNAVVFEVVSVPDAEGRVQAVNQQTQLDLRNRGAEFEAVASLADGLNLIASYSYIDARITRLTPATDGNRLTTIPYHTASGYLDYTVQGGWLRGLGLGVGVRYIGHSLGDNFNRPILENAARAYVDASLRYDLENIHPGFKGTRLQVSATNLANERPQVCSSGYCYFDPGRKVIVSLRYRW